MNPKYSTLKISFADILKIKLFVYLKQLVYGRKLRNYGFLNTFINSKLTQQIVLKNNIVEVAFSIDNKPLKLKLRKNGSDLAVFNQIFINPEYEVVKNFYFKSFDKKLNIIDVGGNIGLTSIYLKTTFPNSKIITLEPELSNFNLAKENALLNGYDDIDFINKGMWIENSVLVPDTNFRDGLSWSFTLKKADIESGIPTNGIQTITLQDIIKNNNLEHIDVLKIDIEGGELDLLNNQLFLSTLEKHVKFIVIEIHPEIISYQLAFEKIKSANFTVFQLKETTVCINNKYININ